MIDQPLLSLTSIDAAPTRYAGGKNGAGVYQRLINLIPPHRVYVEAFLGSGAILRRKRPASTNIGIDVDAGIIAAHVAGGHTELSVAREAASSPHAEAIYRNGKGQTFLCGNAVSWIKRQKWQCDEFIYCDPPYLGSARACVNRPIYRCEMMGAEQHAELLELLTSIPAMVAISGYASSLYDQILRGWNRIEFQAMTRGGLATEVVWMNYPAPTTLHDYSFLGRNFHDRCRIARKIERWTRRLATLPTLERAAVIAALDLGAGGSA